MGFTQNSNISVGSNPIKVMTTRQAGYPLWSDQTWTGTSYYATWNLMPNRAAPTVVANTELALVPSIALAYWRCGNTGTGTTDFLGVNTAGVSPNYPFLGVDQETGPMPYVYVPQGFQATWLVTCGLPVSATLATNVYVTEEFWNYPGGSSVATGSRSVLWANTLTGGIASSTYKDTTKGSWLRPATITLVDAAAGAITLSNPQLHLLVSAGTLVYTPSTSTRGDVAIVPVATTALTPLGGPAEFANSTLPWYSTRCTAAAALFTNVTQVLNKGGTVLAGRVSPQVKSPWQVDTNYISSLHPAEKAFLPLETGHYTYCPPSTDLVQFWDYTLDTTLGSAAAPVYRLDNDSLVNIAFFTSPGSTETMAVTLDWHIEFRTTSALFQVGLSALTMESLHQAQLALSQIGFFFPNNSHKSLIGRVMSGAASWAKTLYPAVEAMVPQANMALKVGKTLHDLVFSNKPHSTIAPTTAGKSGIVEGKKIKAKKAKVAKKKGKAKK